MKPFDYTLGMYDVVKKYDHRSDARELGQILHKMIELEVGKEIDWERIDNQKEVMACKLSKH